MFSKYVFSELGILCIAPSPPNTQHQAYSAHSRCFKCFSKECFYIPLPSLLFLVLLLM